MNACSYLQIFIGRLISRHPGPAATLVVGLGLGVTQWVGIHVQKDQGCFTELLINEMKTEVRTLPKEVRDLSIGSKDLRHTVRDLGHKVDGNTSKLDVLTKANDTTKRTTLLEERLSTVEKKVSLLTGLSLGEPLLTSLWSRSRC